MKVLTTLFCCLWLGLFLVSCSSKQAGTSQNAPIVEPPDGIAVLPVRTLAEEGANLSASGVEELRDGARYANSVLDQELSANPKIVMMTPSDLDKVAVGVTGGLGATISTIGSKMDCDAVLLVTVRRYKQRLGSEYGVDAPASASFKMSLVDTASQKVIWVADFNETQESLLSNILSFGKAKSRGFKWITVEELTSQGIRERLAECPYL